MNTIVCSICGNEVSKRSSLSVGNGKRACRSHQETQEQASNEQKQRQEAEAQRAESLKKRRWGRNNSEKFDIRPKCFGCRAIGLRQDVFGITMLKLSEKYQLKHGCPANPFNPAETKEMYAELLGIQCLFVIPYTNQLKGLSRKTHEVGQVVGIVMLCPKCCELNNINPYKDKHKNVTIDDLMRESVRYETTIRPVIKAVAAQELIVEELMAEILEGTN